MIQSYSVPPTLHESLDLFPADRAGNEPDGVTRGNHVDQGLREPVAGTDRAVPTFVQRWSRDVPLVGLAPRFRAIVEAQHRDALVFDPVRRVGLA